MTETSTLVQYDALPFMPTPERATILSHIVRSIARYETLFTDYERACDDQCFVNKLPQEMCAACLMRIMKINAMLTDPHSRVWEVWGDGELPAGILFLTDVIPGGDARAHYVFFDGNLSSKTELIERMIEWVFTDHDDWIALRRITVEIPAHAFALAHHAAKTLHFGGDFEYRRKVGSRTIDVPVEGVRRNALLWRGRPQDMLIMGRLA